MKQPKLSATYKKYNAKQKKKTKIPSKTQEKEPADKKKKKKNAKKKKKTKIPCKAQEKDPAVKDNIGEKSLKNGF